MKLVHLLSLASIALAGCAVDSATDSDLLGVEDDADLGKGDSVDSTSTYFFGEADLRRCAAPTCGGYFIRSANAEQTRCADGEMADTCKAQSIDFSALGLEGSQERELLAAFGRGAALVGGELVRGRAGVDFPTDSPSLDVLRVREAHLAVLPASESSDVIYRVVDTHIRCITAPCYSLRADALNSEDDVTLSDIDIEVSGASEEQQSAARELLDADGIILAGSNEEVSNSGPARLRGLRMDVSQIYMPVVAEVAAPMCLEDSECTLTTYPRAIETAADCYCPMCPTPALASDAERNAAQHDALCRGLRCAPRPCAPPPPAGCDEGVCTSVIR